jgi:SRSO17 transposase
MVGQCSPLERKSMEPMALEVEGGNVRGMQRFMSDDVWDDAQRRRIDPGLVYEDLGAWDGVVIVDESGFPKKGNAAVGVAWQSCGAVGKVENCPVGVFAAYASRQGDALMDQRRFLPEPWVTNAYARRRAKRRMPAALAFQTKPQLAGAMIRELYQEGILPFKSVVAACLYGKSTGCLDAVETCPGLTSLVAIPADMRCGLHGPVMEDKR